jgi:hypothetical protein
MLREGGWRTTLSTGGVEEAAVVDRATCLEGRMTISTGACQDENRRALSIYDTLL